MTRNPTPDFTCEQCGVTITEDENGVRTNYCKHYPSEDGRMIQSTFHPKIRNKGQEKNSEADTNKKD